MYGTKYRQFCTNLACNLRQICAAPLRKRPLLYDTGEKRSEMLAKNVADFLPLISRKCGRKKFHEKSSTLPTRDKTEFFHGEILGVGGPNTSRDFWLRLLVIHHSHAQDGRPLYRRVQIDYRQRLFLGGINFQLQVQNRASRRMNFHYRDRSVGISAENLSLQIQILSLISY